MLLILLQAIWPQSQLGGSAVLFLFSLWAYVSDRPTHFCLKWQRPDQNGPVSDNCVCRRKLPIKTKLYISAKGWCDDWYWVKVQCTLIVFIVGNGSITVWEFHQNNHIIIFICVEMCLVSWVWASDGWTRVLHVCPSSIAGDWWQQLSLFNLWPETILTIVYGRMSHTWGGTTVC